MSEPLKPRVSIHGQERIFWQPFMYEKMPSICYRCGQLGNVVDDSKLDQEEAWLRGKSLLPQNIYASPMTVKGGDMAKELRTSLVWP